MKEVNPPEVKGTAAGAMNFLVFVMTGIMSPFISRLMLPSQATPLVLSQFQTAFLPLVGGVIVAIILSFFLRETGVAATHISPRDAVIAVPKAVAA
jgi:hypothetical protein